MKKLFKLDQSPVVIIGAGEIGQWVGRHLMTANRPVIFVDPKPPMNIEKGECQVIKADALRPDTDLKQYLSRADTLMLCLPESIAVPCVDLLGSICKPEATVIDTLSAKQAYSEHLQIKGFPQSFFGMQPLFKPTLATKGRGIAVVSYQGEAHLYWMPVYQSWQAKVMCFDHAAEHDAAMHYIQTLPHLMLLTFSEVLSQFNGDIQALTEIAPPPFKSMLAMSSRMLSGSPEVYWDIQTSKNTIHPLALNAIRNIQAYCANQRKDEFINAWQANKEFTPKQLSGTMQNLCQQWYSELK